MVRVVGEPPRVRLRAARPPRARDGARPDRHGERRARVRLAVRLPEGRPRAARAGARAVRAREARPRTASCRSCRRCWCARSRSSGPASCPTDRAQIYEIAGDDLYLVGTSEVSLAALHADEILRRGRPAAPLRGLLDLLPARGRRGRARTRAASSACTSSTRSRCSRSCARRTPATSTSGCSRSRRRSCGELEIPYRVVNVAAGDLGASAAKKYDCEAWLPGPGPLPRADVVLEHHRLPGAPPARPLPARRRRLAAAGPHAQRHGGRGRAHADRDHGEPPDRRRRRGRAGGAALLRRAPPRCAPASDEIDR